MLRPVAAASVVNELHKALPTRGPFASGRFSGVVNYPTVSRFDGNIRHDINSVGLGFAREVEMIASARELGLYTICYIRTPDEGVQMAKADVDVVVPHIGLSGSRIMPAKPQKRADGVGGTDASPARLAFRRFAITPPDGIAASWRTFVRG